MSKMEARIERPLQVYHVRRRMVLAREVRRRRRRGRRRSGCAQWWSVCSRTLMSNYRTRAHELASNIAEHERTLHEGNRGVNVREDIFTLACGDMRAHSHARGRPPPAPHACWGHACVCVVCDMCQGLIARALRGTVRAARAPPPASMRGLRSHPGVDSRTGERSAAGGKVAIAAARGAHAPPPPQSGGGVAAGRRIPTT